MGRRMGKKRRGGRDGVNDIDWWREGEAEPEKDARGEEHANVANW